MMEEKSVQYRYLKVSDLETPEYHTFIERCYGEGSYEERKRRMLWYWQLGEESYRVYTASINGHFVGQSCGYKTKAIVDKKEIEIWWSVDTYVLPEARGYGVGKHLQRELHQTLPNFSSAWYSPTNGAIKRKCGAKSIFSFPFAYYPVSCFFSVLVELALKKIIDTKIILPKIRLPWIYYRVNCLNNKWKDGYSFQEISTKNIPDLSGFMRECLSESGFYIDRSHAYLQWNYVDNPRMDCRGLLVSKMGKPVGVVIFSSVQNGIVVASEVKEIKIYDSLFLPNSGLTHKYLMSLAIGYYKKRGRKIDGVHSLQDINYYPSLTYPRGGTKLLSMMDANIKGMSYLTFLDQDMV